MMKNVLMILVVLFSSNIIILDSYQTHVSTPIITSDKINYKQGENLIISGWVSYNDESTSDVLLRITATNPSEIKIFDQYTTSNIDGTFSIEIPITTDAEVGIYSIQVTSQCREIHREICTHQYESIFIDVESISNQNKIPNWIKNIFEWYAADQVSEDELLDAIKYLINEKILVVN